MCDIHFQYEVSAKSAISAISTYSSCGSVKRSSQQPAQGCPVVQGSTLPPTITGKIKGHSKKWDFSAMHWLS